MPVDKTTVSTSTATRRLENPELDQHAFHSQAMTDPPETLSPATSAPSMTAREKELWAMSVDELYDEARRYKFGSSNFAKGKSESKKSGRVRILKWILKKEGVTPYAAPRDTVNEGAAESTAPRPTNRNGAIDHPEAILQTSDAALQRQIDEAKATYLKWTGEDLVALAMQRSYQLFKDSAGKMPTRAKPQLAQWLAAWDVLKSPREKKWWLGDGIDLVNKAKALGYDGSSTKKCDVIVWLRSTVEEAEALTAHVAEPSCNPRKRKADKPPDRASNRPAKGSRRPAGWKRWSNNLLGD